MTERNQSAIDSTTASFEAVLETCGRGPVAPKRVRRRRTRRGGGPS
jgi:hypothetical protein